MTAEQERSIDRWLKEFTDEYLSPNFDRVAWREIKGKVTFVFMYHVTNGSFIQISVDYNVESIPDKPTRFWLDRFKDVLMVEIERYFFDAPID